MRGPLTAKAIDEPLKLCHKIGPTAIAGGTSARSQFETAYDACMRNRGYKLLK